MLRMAIRHAALLVPLLLSVPALSLASTVKVTTDPPGALVQLDGVVYGLAPVEISNVSAGLHELKVSLDGYVTRVDGLHVTEDAELEVHAPLSPAPKKVEAPAPPRSDASKSKPVPVPPPPPPLPPPPVVTQPLPPPPPPPPTGATPTPPRPPVAVSEQPGQWAGRRKTLVLTVTTTPPNAMVQVIGLPEVKKAPAVFPGFAAGTVKVRVFAPGYREQVLSIALEGDVRTHVTLEPGP